MSWKTPFDSFTLAAVVAECAPMERGRVQKITQPNPLDIVLEVHANRQDYRLLLSADPTTARAHLISQRGPSPTNPPAFCMALRKFLDGASVVFVRQVRFDRIIEVVLRSRDGAHYRLVTEIMGKHSNIILVSPGGDIVNAIKHVSHRLSRVREVLPHRLYHLPPTTGRPNPLEATLSSFQILFDRREAPVTAWLSATYEGISPLLAQELWLRAEQDEQKVRETFFDWQAETLAGQYSPVLVRDDESHPVGAYPTPLLSVPAENQFARDSISLTLEYVYNHAIPRAAARHASESLIGGLRKTRAATERAIGELGHAIEQGRMAERWQLFGDIILAFGRTLPEGADMLEAPDYTQEGQPTIEIPIDGTLTVAENAERYYRKAKRGKEAAGDRERQMRRLELRLTEVEAAIEATANASEDLNAITELRARCVLKGWIGMQSTVANDKPEERPYEGRRIRTLITDDGWVILFGENASANDYLTQRVAQSNDWWLHVRAAVSAHVVIRTQNRPLAVPRSVLEQAARIAVANSPSKHSSVVPVDYTLKKHVRKPRGSPPGAALYTHEKTLHVDAKG